MSSDPLPADLLAPPEALESLARGRWLTMPPDDPVVSHIRSQLWDGAARSPLWQAARLSHAVYLYHEVGTGWTVIAKYYTVKTGRDATHHAERERERLEQAAGAGLSVGPLRAVRFLSLWRGILFQEYIDGLTLEDLIAVRATRPGALESGLGRIAHLLATLHTCGQQPDRAPDFGPALSYAHKMVDELARWGVLEGNEIVRDGLRSLIDRWDGRSAMHSFVPSLVHGDATSSNFIFPAPDKVVAIDWERLWITDPAYDLGRLMAEISHSITRWGGDESEARTYTALFAEAYRNAPAAAADDQDILDRAAFFQASSALRIARNGWVSRLDRMGLVAQAMALLATPHQS
jgi:aminoglycoside phosphotransferase